MRNLIVAALAAVLVACGGGGGGDGGTGGGSVSNALPGGLYNGTAKSDVQNQTYTLLGAVNESGDLQFVNLSNGLQYSGRLNVSGTSAGANINVFDANGNKLTTGSLSGTLASRSSYSATYSTANGDRGSISLSYDRSAYEQAITLAQVAGSYRYTSTRNGGTSSLTLNANGSFTGTNEFGCNFNGTASVADARFNLLAVSATSTSTGSGCVADNFTGFAFMVAGSPAHLKSAITGSSVAGYADYTKQ